MKEVKIDSDLAKELITVLFNCENEFTDKIPSDFLLMLNDLSADSHRNYYIDNNLPLDKQNITEECKDMLSLLYYCFSINVKDKDEILNIWIKNEYKNN